MGKYMTLLGSTWHYWEVHNSIETYTTVGVVHTSGRGGGANTTVLGSMKQY